MTDALPEEGVTVLAYNPEWVDDYSPAGIREAFLEDGNVYPTIWLTALWDNSLHTWKPDISVPTHWMAYPLAPFPDSKRI